MSDQGSEATRPSTLGGEDGAPRSGDVARDEQAAIERLRRAARALALPPVPPQLARTLRELFRGRRAGGRHEAVLVDDSRSRGDLVGVRGGAGADEVDVGGWSVSYSSAVGDLVVDVWPRKDAGFDVDLQILVPGASLAEFDVSLTGPVALGGCSDAFGHVSLGAIPSGTYALVVGNGDLEIVGDVTVERSR